MIDFEDLEPQRRAQIMYDLRYQVDMLRRGRTGISTALISDLHGVLRDLRARLRREGIDFPQMAAIPLQSVGEIVFLRKDLGRKALQQNIVNICVSHPMVDMMELATAIKGVFPGFRPDPVPRAQMG